MRVKKSGWKFDKIRSFCTKKKRAVNFVNTIKIYVVYRKIQVDALSKVYLHKTTKEIVNSETRIQPNHPKPPKPPKNQPNHPKISQTTQNPIQTSQKHPYTLN